MARYDKNALRAEIIRNGMNMDQVADALNIARPTAYKRLNSGDWRLEDCRKLVEILHLTSKDVNRIFFA